MSLTERRSGRGCVGEQRLTEGGIGPGAGDDAGADMRADLLFIGLDDRIEGRCVGVALVDQDGLQGAYPEVRFREFRGLVIMVMMFVIGHGRDETSLAAL